MASKNHREGGKMGGKHTTVVDAAQKYVDMALKMPEVTKVVAGFITHGIKGRRLKIKIKDINGGITLTVKGNVSVQEIHIYTKNIKKTKNAFKEFC